ncbi:MAG TPA: hypothetical protein VGP08_08555, partial [Pyrinomonadaceae bacterium]|nr:hypothetical protein [Pyrinomonadaceae bacterium]
MWAGRSNTLLRVAVISFLFAAPVGAARAQPAQGQKPAQADPQKSEPQKTGQPKADATPQPQADGQQQKGAVPAANGRASSLDIQMDGPRVQPADDTKPVIVHTDLVTLTVTVTDTYGRFVTGLNQNAFQILDDKTAQQITFFSDEDAPVSLGVVFDVSGSMGGDKIAKAREALAKFIDTSHSRDEYFLIGFNNRAQLL